MLIDPALMLAVVLLGFEEMKSAAIWHFVYTSL